MAIFEFEIEGFGRVCLFAWWSVGLEDQTFSMLRGGLVEEAWKLETPHHMDATRGAFRHLSKSLGAPPHAHVSGFHSVRSQNVRNGSIMKLNTIPGSESRTKGPIVENLGPHQGERNRTF